MRLRHLILAASFTLALGGAASAAPLPAASGLAAPDAVSSAQWDGRRGWERRAWERRRWEERRRWHQRRHWDRRHWERRRWGY